MCYTWCMETQQQPANRITVEQAKAIVEAINPGMEDEYEYDPQEYEYEDE